MIDYFLFSGLVATSILLVVQHVANAKENARLRSSEAHYVSALERYKRRFQWALTAKDPETVIELSLIEITDELTNHNH